MRRALLAVMGVAAGLVAPEARASCSFSAVNTLAFPSYDPLSGADTDGTGTFKFKCTAVTGISIDLDGGLRGNRTMTRNLGGSDVLAYTVFQDLLRTTTWGSTALTHLIFATAPLIDTTITVYGRIAKRQDIKVGDYSDTLKITINY